MSDLDRFIKALPNRVHIGITATRKMPTRRQYAMLHHTLQTIYNEHHPFENPTVTFFHHGDCVGGDVAGAQYAERLGYVTVAHPPIDPKWRAFHRSTVILDTKEYRERNQDIVDKVSTLIVVPKTNQEELRSGTWMTYRMARERGIHRIKLWPNGLIVEEKGVPDDTGNT